MSGGGECLQAGPSGTSSPSPSPSLELSLAVNPASTERRAAVLSRILRELQEVMEENLKRLLDAATENLYQDLKSVMKRAAEEREAKIKMRFDKLFQEELSRVEGLNKRISELEAETPMREEAAVAAFKASIAYRAPITEYKQFL